MSDIAVLESFFRDSVIVLEDVIACIVAETEEEEPAAPARSFNSIAPGKTAFPYHIYQVIPLQDKFGQAKTSILSRFYIDSKFLTTFPVSDTIDPAIDAIKEYFRTSDSFDSDGYRISIRHDRPLSYIERGATADERILHRGSTFYASMHKTS